MTRALATAQTQDSSGGPVSPLIAGKNAIINGGFANLALSSAGTGGYVGEFYWVANAEL